MLKIIIKTSSILILAFSLVSCDGKPPSPYEHTELAMQEGMQIEATNKNGTVFIDFISPLERRYRWDKFDEQRTLIPRKERFLGKLGAYEPAESFVWSTEPRIVAEDSQLHFNSMNEVEKWLYQSSDVYDWVYTNDGLVVGFIKTKSRNQVSIDVYQIFLNGKKPKSLKGSKQDKIKITYAKNN